MTKQHIEFVLSGYGVPYTDALADKLLEMFDEEAASYQHTINKLNKALSENKGEWIPVTERLPEIGQRVIATIETLDGLQVRETIYDKYGFLCGNGIAWQPLPEPYKEKGE